MPKNILLKTVNSAFAKQISLFVGLNETEQNLLFKAGVHKKFSRKKQLFRHGGPVTHFYVIISGAVRLFHETPDGCEITTDIRIAGDTLCATEIFSQSSMHHKHAMAVNDVTVLEFPMGWLRETAQEYPKVALNLLTSFSRQKQQTEIESENHSIMSATQLAACFLQKICVFHGLDISGFNLPYNKSLVASRIGIKLETLSRTFPKLKKIGIIVEDRHVSITDLQSVKKNVCEHCSGINQCRTYKSLYKEK